MSDDKMKKDSNQQAQEQSVEQAKEQIDEAIVEPVRAYGVLTTDYFEQLFSAQFDSVRAFADKSLEQSRAWLKVKDSDSFRQVIEEQQQAARDLSDQMKEDAEKIQSLNQKYLKDTQQLASDSMESGRKNFEENMQKSKDQVENSFQTRKVEAVDTEQKSQQQSDKSKKSTSTSDN